MVAESGIRTADDIAKLAAAGYDAFLVSHETLMRQPEPAATLALLLGRQYTSELLAIGLKICANTNLDDAQLAAEMGCRRPRLRVRSQQAAGNGAQVASITPHLPHTVERVGRLSHAGCRNEIAGIAQQSGPHRHSASCRGSSPRLPRASEERFEGRISLHPDDPLQQVDTDGSSAATVSHQLAQLNADGVVDRRPHRLQSRPSHRRNRHHLQLG